MGRYTYTASLVNESIHILQRADQELSGTNAAVINAVDTILNARGADRLSMDFDDIINLTDYARDDIATVTKEIQSKQTEIEEYQNAPWWKKLFASLGMAILKFIEGRAQAIEYMFDLIISLAGFIGGIFNSDFKSSCQEFAEKEHIDNWFTQQYLSEKGVASWINSYSIFSYDSTAANIVEFGGSALQGLYSVSVNPIGGAASLYKSFENVMKTSDTKAITTSNPIVAASLKEAFEVTEVEGAELPSVNDNEDAQTPAETTSGEENFTGDQEESGKSTGVNNGGGSTYTPVVDPFQGGSQDTVSPSNTDFEQPTSNNSGNIYVSEDTISSPSIVHNPTNTNTNQDIEILDNLATSSTTNIPTASSATEEITKKTSGSLKDINSGSSSTPVSPMPLSSKNDYTEETKIAPLASGGLAAGLAGIGVKAYIDKQDKKNESKNGEIETEKWEENDNVEIDYHYGVEKVGEADYLSPSDELAFQE